MRLSFALIISTGLLACSTGFTQYTAEASASPVGPRVMTDGPASPEAMLHATPQEPAATVKPKLTYNSVNVDGRYVALTFDDGPHKTLTPKLLDMLKGRNVKATFFVLGQNVTEYPDIARRIVAEGHEIANHSWSHASFTKLSSSGVRSQLERTDAAIEKVTGARSVLVRPPYGATNSTVRNLIAEDGAKEILWSVDPLDWKYRNAERVARVLTTEAHPGAILLAHDIHATTVAAVPATLEKLLAQGYKFVTVSELLAMERPPAPKPTPSPAVAAAAAALATPQAAKAASPVTESGSAADPGLE